MNKEKLKMATAKKSSTKKAAAPETTDESSSSIVLDFVTERETKGTFRFAEDGVPDGERPVVGTLYVNKAALASIGNPETLVVTIQAG
jgi:hypothetical protein